MSGYAHPLYAYSLKEFGAPRPLPECGAWILERRIPGTPYKDAMGCYPLFACRDVRKIHDDLESMKSAIVCILLVTDPFQVQDLDYLRQFFRDKFTPFKEHYIADLQRPLHEIAGKRHRRSARRAFRNIEIDVSKEPWRFVDEWQQLYETLLHRHQIKGLRRFSRQAFAAQLRIPGTVLLRAVYKGKAVGAQIYFSQNEVVHRHIGAASPMGYGLGAFPALDYYSLQYFSDKAKYLNFGGGAGTVPDDNDGLCLYKKGWSTETRKTYLCGRIFDTNKYREITAVKKAGRTEYFPAYRKDEFA